MKGYKERRIGDLGSWFQSHRRLNMNTKRRELRLGINTNLIIEICSGDRLKLLMSATVQSVHTAVQPQTFPSIYSDMR